MKKDVLNKIVNFSAWYASEQDAVDERREKTVKLTEAIAVAGERRTDLRADCVGRTLKRIGVQMRIAGGGHRMTMAK